MFNREKLAVLLARYKNRFPSIWKNEKYKWESIKHFQDRWNLEAENFRTMFEQATARTKSLLTTGHNFPRGMIIEFARADDEGTRAMFRDLADESRDLSARVAAFQAAAEAMRVRYNDGTWRNHFQSTNAISTYLWLMYPDKYYIYKYNLYLETSRELGADYVPWRDGSARTMVRSFAMYDEIRAAIVEDQELLALLKQALTPDCYPDPTYRTLMCDFGHYVGRYYPHEKDVKQVQESWEPKDYASSLTTEDWTALLADSTVFTPGGLQIMKRLRDCGGQASCAQLAAKYGETANFYSTGFTELARRVAEVKGLPMVELRPGEAQWWPILFVGRASEKGGEGDYVFKIRDALKAALDRADLGGVEQNAKAEPEEAAHAPAVQKYTREDFLSKVYMSEARFDVLMELLKYRKNIILQGAPGVGKTFTARRLAYALMGEVDDERIEMVQFHQNYSYEDFVMGYRPDGADFKLTEGIFYRFCRRAAKSPDQPFFFIIDEINRGNMSKIFGELLMLIDKDYRTTEVTLAYSGMPFSVPENLYLIGMMNTADRSLAMIDYALRRRFSFFDMDPGFNSEGFMKYQRDMANETFDELIDQIKLLNREILEDKSLGRGFQIGHSYFCERQALDCTDEWMQSVVEFDILPTLSEYWFDEPKKLALWEKNLRGVFDD